MLLRSALASSLALLVTAVPSPLDHAWRGPSTTISNTDYHFSPAVAAGAPNQYLVAFHADTCGDGCDDVQAVRVLADSAQGTFTFLDASPISVDNLANAPSKVRAAGSNGEYLVVWEQDVFLPPNTFPPRIFAALVSAAGEPTPLSVISGSDGEEKEPAVAGSSNGDWLVVWDDNEAAAVQGPALHARLVHSTGVLAPAGADLLITDDLGMPDEESSASVAWDGSRYLVVYEEGDGNIHAVPVTVAGGNPVVGTSFRVSQTPAGSSASNVAIGCAGGACVVVWEDDRNGPTTGVDLYANRITAAGAGATDVPLITAPGDQVAVAIAAGAGDANVMVMWFDSGLHTRWVDPTTLAALAPDFALGINGPDHDVATSTSGQYLIVHAALGGPVEDIAVRLELALPNGSPCPTLPAGGLPDPPGIGDGCLSGVCVGGLCCNSTCEGVCATCSGLSSTTPAGTCGVITAGSQTLCRAGSTDNICDPAEYCDGMQADCPSDLVQPSSFECRSAGAAPTCDLAENCTGTPLEDCPPDMLAADMTVCRPASGDPCDLEELCDGISAMCPADIGRQDGEVCDADKMTCNGVPICMAFTCADPGPIVCEDDDPCTADSCVEGTGCVFEPIAGCGEDAGIPDAVVEEDAAEADAGVRPDAPVTRPDARLPDLGIDVEDQSNDCNCGTVKQRRGDASLWLFAALLLLGFIRRAS